MINHIYQLIAPRSICVKNEDISFGDRVIVQPEYMALCHADQRYFQGKRSMEVLRRKLPMALIHECCGRIVYDPFGQWTPGQRVVLIPNVCPKDAGLIYENYAKGSAFLSSGRDGFMRELVDLAPDRIVPYEQIDPKVAAITEFVSVAAHAVTRFDRAAHEQRRRVGIWGDGSLAYVVANVLKACSPNLCVAVIGMQQQKLAQFSFADETYLASELPDTFEVDHAFECCGGEGSFHAIQDVIRCINPQGTLMLMGVSENLVPIETRMVLEKGLTLVGCSRSGRADFELAISLMEDPGFQRRLKRIIFDDGAVRSIGDIHRVFEDDLSTPFKTVFRWEL